MAQHRRTAEARARGVSRHTTGDYTKPSSERFGAEPNARRALREGGENRSREGRASPWPAALPQSRFGARRVNFAPPQKGNTCFTFASNRNFALHSSHCVHRIRIRTVIFPSLSTVFDVTYLFLFFAKL